MAEHLLHGKTSTSSPCDIDIPRHHDKPTSLLQHTSQSHSTSYHQHTGHHSRRPRKRPFHFCSFFACHRLLQYFANYYSACECLGQRCAKSTELVFDCVATSLLAIQLAKWRRLSFGRKFFAIAVHQFRVKQGRWFCYSISECFVQLGGEIGHGTN